MHTPNMKVLSENFVREGSFSLQNDHSPFPQRTLPMLSEPGEQCDLPRLFPKQVRRQEVRIFQYFRFN